MKYKYIWVVLYSQWFVRIYRLMYIICRTLHVEHSRPGDSHTICTHARTPSSHTRANTQATHTRRVELVIHTALTRIRQFLIHVLFFFLSFFL